MRIILTGASGLIGSRFEELLFENHEIVPLSSKEIDVTDKNSVDSFFDDKKADILLHLAAKTDVDKCEEDKLDDLKRIGIHEDGILDLDIKNLNIEEWKEGTSAFAINSIGALNIYDACLKNGIKFVYVSTDFIFEGNGEYTEESVASPLNWYGMTKFFGEKIIDKKMNLIVRLSFPYGNLSPVKKDFVWKLVDLLAEKEEAGLISDQTITPTFIDDIIWGLDFLISKKETGVYHLTGSSYENPYQIGQKIKDKFGFQTRIKETLRDEVYNGRAQRPFKSIMKNDKLANLGFKTKTFDEGFELIKNSYR